MNFFAALWYVNQNATGNDDGTSWTDAFTDLQDAIAASNFGDQIWVASGIYKPTTTSTRTIYFSIKNGTQLYAGFNGTETLVTERDPELNLTVLSGEIGTGAINDNTYHVVYFNNVGNQTLIDGFNITAGYISGSSGGGGMYSSASSPSIINCNFYGNTAYDGGAVYLTGAGIVTFNECTFNGNVGTNHAGVMHASIGVTCNMTRCDFTSNQSIDAGVMYLANTLNNFDQCRFSGNQSSDLASCILILGNAATIMNLTNSLLVGNYAGDDHVIYSPPLSSSGAHTIRNCTIANNFQVNVNSTSTVVALNDYSYVSNSIFHDNSGAYQLVGANTAYNCIMDGGGFSDDVNILDVDPLFINPGITGMAPFVHTAYNYHLDIMSPGIDFGDNSMVVGSTDLDNTTRIQNSTVDLGAYESGYCSSPVTISGNPSFVICSGSPI
ncbi:MAG: hypothetical protein IPH24_09700 [Crocinitomicaceae bacterium]|nr:hypothetical protein [Crocinitomicaceae bacterium]